MQHLQYWPNDITPHELAKDICARLSEYYDCIGTVKQVRFVLPGIDSTSYEYPSEGLALAYSLGGVEFRFKLARALVELAGYREYLTTVSAIQQVLLAISGSDCLDAYPAACSTLAARDDLGEQHYPIYATALQVGQRFGPKPKAWDGINALVDTQNFPRKLIFDAFELCISDLRPGSEWWLWFIRHESIMIDMSAEPRHLASTVQLRRAAKRLELKPLEQTDRGLKAIFGNALSVIYNQRQQPQTPDRILLHELTQRSGAKYEYTNVDGKLELRFRMQLPNKLPPKTRFMALQPQGAFT